ncbi:hypothetical protein CVS40_4864 [Lucilia cuprina]|nr:hypothetical protein CVS40_4864 [Lucilia cuprina]
MADDDINPNKRQRVVSPDEEMQRMLRLKDEQIEKLQKRVDELVKMMHGSLFMKPTLSDDEFTVGKSALK